MLEFQAIFENQRQYHKAKIETLPIYNIKETSMKTSVSLPADVLWGSFVTHSFLPKRTPKDVCGEARRQYEK